MVSDDAALSAERTRSRLLTDPDWWILSMSNSEQPPQRRPGPRREEGAPVGPDEVRRAVLDAAAELFVAKGVHGVSLRDIAAAADVHPALIGRYIGTRDELVLAVFDDLTSPAGRGRCWTHPLSGQGHGPDTVMGKWVRVANQLVIEGRPIVGRADFNPVMAMAQTLRDGYGLDDVGSAAASRADRGHGARVADLRGLPRRGRRSSTTCPLETLRDELVHSARRLGATPWPSPPDPSHARTERPRPALRDLRPCLRICRRLRQCVQADTLSRCRRREMATRTWRARDDRGEGLRAPFR